VTAPARLLSVRLQGFKSFAERTHVEFGPGISAIVGPNGSGKSNLADALRWALGEQGRALRSRKAEDVIWAGSERRSAVGMADVQLVLDNADALLPVEFGVVELGRRLYRSGENDYLLNRQRVRLKDLVDLLDAAHLAENAFLFIGQGMVDQALALRPEERRPLFEEVAGVRRHERRRRRAEEQLTESEANLARVEDIVAELRPQARRLGIQAEQQASRRSAGDELAAALLLVAHDRWHGASARVRARSDTLARARAEADDAMGRFTAAEAAVAAIASGLSGRAAAVADARAAADGARAALTDLRLAEGRLAAETSGIGRDRARLAGELEAAEADVARHRRAAVEPVPGRAVDLEADLAAAERVLAEALAEIATLQAAGRAHEADLAALRRAESARAAERETARRRLAEAGSAAAAEAARASGSEATRTAAVAEAAVIGARLEAARMDESAAVAAREAATAALATVEAIARAASEDWATVSATRAAVSGQLAAAERRLAGTDDGGLAAAARPHGGRRIDQELQVDSGLRAAVDAAVAGRGRAVLLGRAAVPAVAASPGTVVVEEALAAVEAPPAALAERVRRLGGGFLVDAVRRDPRGGVRRLVARTAWLPDLAACLELQPDLPPGWACVPRDGSALVTDATVSTRPGDGALQAQAELERLRAEAGELERGATTAGATADAARVRVAAARAALEDARGREASAAAERRRLEELERAAGRSAEAAARESAWHAAQAARLGADAERLRAVVADGEAADRPSSGSGPAAGTGAGAALGTWEARATELRTARDRLAAQLAEMDGARREAETRRTRADAAVAYAEARIASARSGLEALGRRDGELAAERDRLERALADGSAADATTRTLLDGLLGEDAADRRRLGDAEGAATAARERSRVREEAARVTERDELEARLALENTREQLLVELAGLGSLALRHLRAVADGAEPTVAEAADAGAREPAEDADEAGILEVAMDGAAARWTDAPPAADVPTPGRLATLRRRYHELGAANPYAVDEYSTLKVRLDGLETQAGDLRHAIEKTRSLIAELDALIAEQFRTTFRALETAFDERFRQLFGGGYAKLALTDPSDLSATGIEIVARPPGKKPQALAMLSGGERALTAVALLFAMLEVRPVPFCVLDEVDAALDEANVGRFTTALRELAQRTQCIVITHNRGTIEIADALYGVTVGDDSVSRVISLRLEEATAIAEAVGDGVRRG